MPTKVNGPLLEDYKRALKAAKWSGAKSVTVIIGGTPIVISLDAHYVETMGPPHLPVPDAKPEEEELHNWKQW
jgi:hypothetical protein